MLDTGVQQQLIDLATQFELGVMSKTLQLSKTLKSNKSLSYRILAQIAMSVPNRVKFSSIKYDGKRSVVIMGTAATDQDILKLTTISATASLPDI